MGEWKKRRQCDIQQEYENCLTNFGDAHIAACDTSCEESDAVHQRREEYDLLAAQRGRTAMLQEQRKREREAEERIMQRKRKLQKSQAVQADLISRRDFGTDAGNLVDCEDEEEGRGTRVETFRSKPNLHKASTSHYNPKNFTSNSVDSSNNYDSEEEASSLEVESEEEFNQITNLLKGKGFEMFKKPQEPELAEDVIEIEESSEDEPAPLPPNKKKVIISTNSKKKSILKKPQSPKGKQKLKKSAEPEDQRVNYVDFGNKYVSSYTPDDNLVTRNNQARQNAQTEAKKHEERGLRGVSDDVLRYDPPRILENKNLIYLIFSGN